jgi:toxin ParE1/3/4
VKTIGYFPEALEDFDNALAVSSDPTKFRRVVQKALLDIANGIITHARIPRTTCKRCILKKKLPYSIIYRETDDEIQIVAFPHHKRRPSYWKKRLRPN